MNWSLKRGSSVPTARQLKHYWGRSQSLLDCYINVVKSRLAVRSSPVLKGAVQTKQVQSNENPGDLVSSSGSKERSSVVQCGSAVWSRAKQSGCMQWGSGPVQNRDYLSAQRSLSEQSWNGCVCLWFKSLAAGRNGSWLREEQSRSISG